MGRDKHNASCECRRCGKCCLANMIACAAAEDLSRWRRENRQDILHIIENEHAVWLGDHFISSSTGRPIYGCPFLEMKDGVFSCSIYETRPQVCRDYQPGSSRICPLWKDELAHDPEEAEPRPPISSRS